MKYKLLLDGNQYLTGFLHTNTEEDTIELLPLEMDLNHINCYRLSGSTVSLDSVKLAEVLEEERKKAEEPSELDIMSAQILYTAMMTDTLIENEEDI